MARQPARAFLVVAVAIIAVLVGRSMALEDDQPAMIRELASMVPEEDAAEFSALLRAYVEKHAPELLPELDASTFPHMEVILQLEQEERVELLQEVGSGARPKARSLFAASRASNLRHRRPLVAFTCAGLTVAYGSPHPTPIDPRAAGDDCDGERGGRDRR